MVTTAKAPITLATPSKILRWLSKNPQVGEVSVLAHSMGNWVTLEALRQMAIRDGRVAPKICNVILAAPDVDFDVAREQIRTMGPQKPNFTLLVSENDRALAASRKVWGAPRLGEINSSIEPYRSELASDKINVIDLDRRSARRTHCITEHSRKIDKSSNSSAAASIAARF